MVGLYFDAAALRKQVEALCRMGGQALAGADVGMVAADEVDVFTGGVQLALWRMLRLNSASVPTLSSPAWGQ